MLPDTLYFDGVKYVKYTTPQLWMHKEDQDTDVFSTSSRIRPCALGGCPAVFTLMEPLLKVNLDKQWQYYLIAMNYRMTLENISLILDTHLAFCNDSGFRSGALRNYILDRDLNAVDERGRPAYPRFDKDRTCSRNLLSGQVSGDNLIVKTMDGNQPPPLKPGKRHPQSKSEINLDDYLYNPKEHPWMFVVANRVTVKPGSTTSVAPFPRGATYSWTGNNNNYTFIPLVSRLEIRYPLKNLKRLDMNQPLPSPYRIVTT